MGLVPGYRPAHAAELDELLDNVRSAPLRDFEQARSAVHDLFAKRPVPLDFDPDGGGLDICPKCASVRIGVVHTDVANELRDQGVLPMNSKQLVEVLVVRCMDCSFTVAGAL
jgi:hypothetical protein